MQGQLANLSKSIDEARQFALLAIDDARGETRAWRERFLDTENQLKSQVAITETFRRLAYRQGADIPLPFNNRPNHEPAHKSANALVDAVGAGGWSRIGDRR